jgi:hypothetical protein
VAGAANAGGAVMEAFAGFGPLPRRAATDTANGTRKERLFMKASSNKERKWQGYCQLLR